MESNRSAVVKVCRAGCSEPPATYPYTPIAADAKRHLSVIILGAIVQVLPRMLKLQTIDLIMLVVIFKCLPTTIKMFPAPKHSLSILKKISSAGVSGTLIQRPDMTLNMCHCRDPLSIMKGQSSPLTSLPLFVQKLVLPTSARHALDTCLQLQCHNRGTRIKQSSAISSGRPGMTGTLPLASLKLVCCWSCCCAVWPAAMEVTLAARKARSNNPYIWVSKKSSPVILCSWSFNTLHKIPNPPQRSSFQWLVLCLYSSTLGAFSNALHYNCNGWTAHTPRKEDTRSGKTLSWCLFVLYHVATRNEEAKNF